MRYFIKLSYFGKNFHGWQNQPNAVSVQEIIENSLSLLLKDSTKIVGAGRTDAGVHAKEMFAHFDTKIIFEKETLMHKLNSFLPKDIAIHDIFSVHDDAHARFDAVSRTYEYWMHNKKNPFLTDLSWHFHKDLDTDLMNIAAKILLNYENFKSFSRTHTDVKTYVCRIDKAFFEKKGDLLIFTITADRFLRNMVRAIVGTLIEVGLHKIGLEELQQIIEAKDRQKAGFSVPARGLYLTKIKYPENIRKK